MSVETSSRSALRCTAVLAGILGLIALLGSIPQASVAQIHGIPPSVTSIQNHFPPYLPNVAPSVTSLGPRGYVGPPAFPVYPRYPGHYPGHGGSGRGNGYRYGSSGYGSYFVPYYGSVMDYSNGYDQDGASPNPYGGPPLDQTLHIVVDLPPSAHSAARENDDEDSVRSAASLERFVPDAPPLDSTVLVFRDGHQLQVNNYAIMGQTLYIFDTRTRKIGLGDLDIPATIKLNDDSGIEFHLPKPGPS